jgi:hypothetical protein
MKVRVACSSEIQVNIYKCMWCHIPVDSNVKPYRAVTERNIRNRRQTLLLLPDIFLLYI